MTFLQKILANAVSSIADKVASLRSDDAFLKSARKDAIDYCPPEDDEDEDAILDGYIYERLTAFKDDLEYRGKEDGGQLIIWRVIEVDDKQKFVNYLMSGKYISKSYKGLGTAWSYRYDEDMPAPGGKSNKSKRIVLKAKVPSSGVNIPLSALLALDAQLFEDEKEVRLKKGAKVTVLDVLDYDGESLLSEVQELPAVAED